MGWRALLETLGSLDRHGKCFIVMAPALHFLKQDHIALMERRAPFETRIQAILACAAWLAVLKSLQEGSPVVPRDPDRKISC